MKKPLTYKVRCSKVIAHEMARYEGSTIISSEYPKCNRIYIGQPEEEDMTISTYTIQGEPCIARWHSFGIDVTS